MSVDMLAAALAYAGRGWPVIPLHNPENGACSCHRAECTAVGKHPRTKNGLDDASTSPTKIREWWSKWPDANIGVVTGDESGLLVIDLDNKVGMRGEDSFANLASEFGALPSTLMATTGNGRHLFFTHPGMAIKNSVRKIADGVDVRAARGFVVVAPSLHANGRRYAWVDPDQRVSATPPWLIERLVSNAEGSPVKSTKAGTGLDMHVPMIDQGVRNDTLYRVGCSLRGQLAMSDMEISERLLIYNQCKCVPPLDEEEVLRIAESVCQHPPETKGQRSQRRTERNPLYWFKFSVRDFYADQNIQMMTDYQLGWHTRLQASAWQNGGFLPADHDNLWRLAGAKSKKAFQRDSALVLAEYQQVTIGGRHRLIHREMAAQYAETLEKWMQEKAAGEANRDRLRAEAALRQRGVDAAGSVPAFVH